MLTNDSFARNSLYLAATVCILSTTNTVTNGFTTTVSRTAWQRQSSRLYDAPSSLSSSSIETKPTPVNDNISTLKHSQMAMDMDMRPTNVEDSKSDRQQEEQSGMSPPVQLTMETTQTRKVTRQERLHNQEGIFSPLVKLGKMVLGQDRLNKVRAKGISLHADAIKTFVDKNAATQQGKRVLSYLFHVADKNHNGQVDKTELADAAHFLGFEWIMEKQINGIISRADHHHGGTVLDMDDFIEEAPKFLKTNLVKLAKKNGSALGFLV